MCGARSLKIKEEPKENLTLEKSRGGAKRSQTLVGSRLGERTNSKRRSSRLTSLRSESESRSSGKKRVSLRVVVNLGPKEQNIFEQEDAVEEASVAFDHEFRPNIYNIFKLLKFRNVEIQCWPKKK